MAKRRKRRTDEAHCLTPRPLEILTCIRDGRRSLGYSPTLQEIADEFGISKITVFEHVEGLIENGIPLFAFNLISLGFIFWVMPYVVNIGWSLNSRRMPQISHEPVARQIGTKGPRFTIIRSRDTA